MASPVVLDMPRGAQAESWYALVDLYEDVPIGWSLVGGQMVHLWCVDRGSTLARPTNDADAVLDVRARPQILKEVTDALVRRGFRPDGTTRSGHQHRWVRGEAVMDVLIPRNLGSRVRRGAGGATTIETPGAQKVLNRTGPREVLVNGRPGKVLRPSLIGALGAKASARTVVLDPRRDRHLVDFAILATLLTERDITDEFKLDPLERRRLASMIGDLRAHPAAWIWIDGARDAIQRLQAAISR